MADEETTDTAVPGIGHNAEAGLPTIAEIEERLLAENADALVRTEELVKRGKDFLTISTDQQESDATEYLVKVRARYKFSEADRVANKTPWDDRAGAVQAFFKTKILDVLGLAPPKEEKGLFDPEKRSELGIGPRVNMALTIYKLAKAEIERKAREAEAKRLRDEETKAAAERAAAEKLKRDEEDRLRREAQAKADAERKAAEEAAASAARKRNEATKAEAEAAAELARARAAAAAEANRLENERIAAEREARDVENREAENKIAEERSAAEAAANVSLADLSRSRGGRGGVASLRTSIDHRDVDRAKLDYAALGPYFTDKAIDSALTAYADANRATVDAGIKSGVQPIKGATFFTKARNAGRA